MWEFGVGKKKECGSSRKEERTGEKQSVQENAECVRPQASGKRVREKERNFKS